MSPFPHLLPTPTTTTSPKPSSLMASASAADADADADASKDSPSSPSPPPSSSAPTPPSGPVPSAAAAAASPSPSPSPARSPSHLPLPVPPSASSRRLPPPCWTHEETLALIDSYRDKWYALRRGNLRASHWQEVADSVARRCSRLPQASPKTSVQCRHKVEKLRKRYRAERQRSVAHDPSGPPSSSWVYFRKMDAMEHGSAHSVAAAAAFRPSSSPATPRSRSDDDGDEEEVADDAPGRAAAGGGGNTRSLHRLMANGGGVRGGLRFIIPKAVRSKITTGSRAEERAPAPSAGGVMNPSPTTRFFKGSGGARPAMEEMRRRLEKSRRRRERDSSDAVGEMVSALRTLGDGFMRMEQMKMEMVREMDKVRREMELKRTEMILDSQRRIVDAFVKGFFGGKKRAKVSPEA